MNLCLLHSLCCPFCGGSFIGGKVAQPGFDILTCRCGEYPVVAGIPIIKKGVVGISGETVDDVNSQIRAGRYREALLAMIMPPPPASPALAPAWIQTLPSVKGIRRLKHGAHQHEASKWRDQVMRFLTSPGDKVTASDFLDLYYHRSGFKTDDGYDYFALRFAQPRYLVALSFTTLIHNPRKPLLDLACGFGHITRSLVHRARGQLVIGIDHNFFGLYVAKKFIASEAEYVCCVADGLLPFQDGFFSAALCSDAFHYFVNKVMSVRELKRLTQDDGLIVLTWVHNALLRCPHDGLPLPPEGYQALAADIPHRLVVDNDVLVRYRQKQGPPLARSAELRRLAHEPLLSIVASHRQEVFQDYGVFEHWPHAEGSLGLNPLYTIGERRDGVEEVQLQRTFPSAFYMEDHAQSREYLPETVKAHSQVLDDLACGKRTAEMERLIEQFVVLGMPDRYQ
jgi:SAM-dependent methyltransferase